VPAAAAATGQVAAIQDTAVQQDISAPALSEEEIDQGVKINKEKISLDLKGIDLNELFRILSVKMSTTIVPTKSVSGRINIFLNNLSFDDALDVILISQDLACEKKGGVINVMTSAEYLALYGEKYNEKRKFRSIKLTYAKPQTVLTALGQIKSEIGKVIVDDASGTIFLIDIPEKLDMMEQTVKELDQGPQTEIFDIKYAKPADMKTQLSTAITTGPGELYSDDRSSKVVVSDLPEKMKKIKRMVKAFDEESRQVFIEAEILQVTLKDEFQTGINWQKAFGHDVLDGLNLTGAFPVAASFTPSPLLTNDYLKMIVGTLSEDKYTATINLLQTYGDTKILSRPRLSVVSNTEAKILVGSREAYVTQSQSQATSTTVTSESVSFIDVGVKINVVPTINKDGFITMKIKPEVSSVRETLTTALGSKVPIVETSEAETVVKVKDGQMIMIAGLIKDDKRNDKSGIPILCNLPLLGTLFSTTSTLKKRTELVIFIRPRIISGVGMIPGAEPEKIIPTDIMPKDMKEPIANRIISNRIDEIKEMEPKSKAAPEKFVFSEDRIRQIKKSGKPAASPDMVYELKGVKSGVILSEAKDLKKDSSPRQGGAQNDKVSAPQLEDTGPTDNTESISGKMKGIKKY